MAAGGRAAAGTPSLLRAINERTVIEAVREHGAMSRAQIARTTGLSKPTVSQALIGLEATGLVREAGRSSGARGPAAVLYELNAAAGWVAGIDVGRRWVRAAIADVSGEIVARRDERARSRSANALIAQIGDIARTLAADAGIRWREVITAAVGSPGVVEPGHGHVSLAHNLPGWGREGLVEAVRAELGTNVTFENDVNLATVGEQWKGLGAGRRTFVYLHIGTGVGMGIVIDGRLFRGATGRAGEIGYLPIAGVDGRDPASLRRGALETTIGAAGIRELARSLGVQGSVDPTRVLAAARRGDARAVRVVDILAERIAFTIATVVAVVDPELVVLGGGIGRNGDVLLRPLEHEIASISPFRPTIEPSSLAEDAELHGAVATALAAAHQHLFSRASRSSSAGQRQPRTS
jgi:predicted NBD/HSP70 family sugar kinase